MNVVHLLQLYRYSLCIKDDQPSCPNNIFHLLLHLLLLSYCITEYIFVFLSHWLSFLNEISTIWSISEHNNDIKNILKCNSTPLQIFLWWFNVLPCGSDLLTYLMICDSSLLYVSDAFRALLACFFFGRAVQIFIRNIKRQFRNSEHKPMRQRGDNLVKASKYKL